MSACAFAHDPSGAWKALPWVGSVPGAYWVALEVESIAPSRVARSVMDLTPPLQQMAGATLRDRRGWTASLFVARLYSDPLAEDEGMRIPDSAVVNARLTRRLGHDVLAALDIFNVFDRRAPGVDGLTLSRWAGAGSANASYLSTPGEPRGVRLSLRWIFR
jgi:outer membrane receptor protein involved in Fe transport